MDERRRHESGDTRRVHALSAVDGHELWSDTLPGPTTGGVAASGGMLFVPYGWAWDTGPPRGVVAYGLP